MNYHNSRTAIDSPDPERTDILAVSDYASSLFSDSSVGVHNYKYLLSVLVNIAIARSYFFKKNSAGECPHDLSVVVSFCIRMSISR